MPIEAPVRKFYGRKPPPKIMQDSYYCHQCKITTKHNKDGVCQNPKHGSSNTMSVEDRIDEVFGLIYEAADEPVKYKPENTTKKKSAEGAHRPDKGTEFHQLKYDDQFKTKDDYHKLR